MSLAVATRLGGGALTGVHLDADGFLLEHRLWNRTLAQQLAELAGVGTLGATHWMIIDFVRDKYFRTGAMPPMRNLCRRLGMDRDAVKRAFGTCRQLWQIAGLPNPGSEALTYMG